MSIFFQGYIYITIQCLPKGQIYLLEIYHTKFNSALFRGYWADKFFFYCGISIIKFKEQHLHAPPPIYYAIPLKSLPIHKNITILQVSLTFAVSQTFVVSQSIFCSLGTHKRIFNSLQWKILGLSVSPKDYQVLCLQCKIAIKNGSCICLVFLVGTLFKTFM